MQLDENPMNPSTMIAAHWLRLRVFLRRFRMGFTGAPNKGSLGLLRHRQIWVHPPAFGVRPSSRGGTQT